MQLYIARTTSKCDCVAAVHCPVPHLAGRRHTRHSGARARKRAPQSHRHHLHICLRRSRDSRRDVNTNNVHLSKQWQILVFQAVPSKQRQLTFCSVCTLLYRSKIAAVSVIDRLQKPGGYQ